MPIACYKKSKLGAPHAPKPNHSLEDLGPMARLQQLVDLASPVWPSVLCIYKGLYIWGRDYIIGQVIESGPCNIYRQGDKTIY